MSKRSSIARSVALPIVAITVLHGKASAAWSLVSPALTSGLAVVQIDSVLNSTPRTPKPSLPPAPARRIWANYTTRRSLVTPRRRRRRGQ